MKLLGKVRRQTKIDSLILGQVLFTRKRRTLVFANQQASSIT